jgi:hypothetical protein
MSIDVYHVVVHPRRSAVGHAGGQLCVARTLRFDQTQSAARQGYDDVIEAMDVLARFCTRCEGPLRYDDAVIFDLYGWDGFHVCNPLSIGSSPSLAELQVTGICSAPTPDATVLPSPASSTAIRQGSEDALEDSRWSRWTARYRDVDGNNIRYPPAARIALPEHPAGATAVTQRNDQLRLRRGLVGT